jgi:hypothetical protein
MLLGRGETDQDKSVAASLNQRQFFFVELRNGQACGFSSLGGDWNDYQNTDEVLSCQRFG